MKTPRVLQVVLSLNPGGTERLVVELVKRTSAEIPSSVCCLDEPGTWAAELQSRDILVESLGREPGFHPAFGRRVAAAARRHKATVIHAHHYSPFVYSCLARFWNPGCQVIFTEHGRLSDDAPSRKRRMVNGVFGRVPHAIYAVSDDLKRHMVNEGFAESSIRVAHNGIDVGTAPTSDDRARARRDLEVPDDTVLLGTIARLNPVKDLGTLLEATRLLASNLPVALVVVGEGAERPRLEQLARDLGISRLVTFLGHRDDARRWLAGCDVYVNCSISEGISLTILEAMAAALPVIATRVGGNPEVIDRSCGRLVEARNPAALADTVRALLSQDDRRLLGRAARERVLTSFTLDRMVATYRAAYEGMN